MTIGSPSRAWCATLTAPERTLCVSVPVGKVEMWRQSCRSEGELTPAPTPKKTCRVPSVETSSAKKEALRKGRAVAGLSVFQYCWWSSAPLEPSPQPPLCTSTLGPECPRWSTAVNVVIYTSKYIYISALIYEDVLYAGARR